MDSLLAAGGVLFFLLLTVGTGLAVAAEFSLTALERSTVETNIRQRGDRRARTVLKAHRTLSFQLSGAQVAITITTLVSGFLAEPIVGELVRPLFTALGAGERAAGVISLATALFLATSLSMVLGEMVPKNLAIAHPLGTARFVAGYHSTFSDLFAWLIRLLNNSANRIVRLFGIEPQEELRSARSPQELGSIVRSSAERGTLNAATAELLGRSLRFGNRTAGELMTPRVRIQYLLRHSSINDLLALARSTGLSRFPVCSEDLDGVIGAVHIKQAFTVPAAERDAVEVVSLTRPIPTVPESLQGDALLNRLRDSGLQLAIIVDEYGGTAGLVTLEDVVEEIIGDVRDEHDYGEEAPAKQTGEHSWLVSGQLRGDELAEVTGFVMPEGDYETVAGLVLATLGAIPSPGESVTVGDWQLTVTRLDRHRIAELSVRKLDAEEMPEHGTVRS
ncbi:Hemolysin, contains CBS domains [Haloechinothrix alba]|uniref:Hemolysin, contains CBS domains n=1 Tax=Haloechinothrix alba TaxID=664784 RepID=A0A238X8J8_9PSEU|nr:hemolysin family protein [Haloechinothrix alba]SNR54891.1 Hemolysin, contains CBS domains [Haloechinothrix alba]